jgi:hypothetical protein
MGCATCAPLHLAFTRILMLIFRDRAGPDIACPRRGMASLLIIIIFHSDRLPGLLEDASGLQRSRREGPYEAAVQQGRTRAEAAWA